MLSKITKLIGFGVIIGLSGLCAYGNRIDVFYEGGPTLVAEGIDDVELPAELSDPSHDLWDEYDPYVKFVGIRLNLPQELIADCEDKYWKIHDDALIQELEEIVSTEENFHAWCDKQKNVDCLGRHLCSEYAYIFKTANEKNYFISGDFCLRTKLNYLLKSIFIRNWICLILEPDNPIEKYLQDLGCTMQVYFMN